MRAKNPDGYWLKDKPDTGVRSATALAKFFATNPELIKALEARGVTFSAYDFAHKSAYANLEGYFDSNDWKEQNRAINAAKKTLETKGFQEKLAKIEELTDKAKKVKSQADYDKIIAQVESLRVETATVMGRAYSMDLVNQSILELATPKTKSITTDLLVTRVNENIAAEVGVKDTKASGKTLDPAKAAKAAARIAK